jgi:hypothetical protein
VLTRLDDSLLHQAPTTFDHAVTSDHRFYDRYWFQAIEPGGATSLVAGMGLYKNTNVLDGFCTVVHDGKQYCLRVSRALRPAVDDTSVGALSVDVIEGLRQLRIGPARASSDRLRPCGRTTMIEEPPMWRRLGVCCGARCACTSRRATAGSRSRVRRRSKTGTAAVTIRACGPARAVTTPSPARARRGPSSSGLPSSTPMRGRHT